ncbi:MAG: phosphoribosylanthranilate isomerase [Flavobacteriales bacterium]|nr:phosphoribosylanthranilate isomerase [Flavobacteriales bacterium]
MKHAQNIQDLSALAIDFMGFIFYPNSKRCVENESLSISIKRLNPVIQKVGVFVNQPVEYVLKTCQLLQLQYTQLHGNETPNVLEQIKKAKIGTIKVFSPTQEFQWKDVEPFISGSDYFLFDTPTILYGGSGQQFDWNLLSNYPYNVPFFLSGGIGPDDIKSISKLSFPQLAGIDVNSGVEIEPALKDISKVKAILKQVRNEHI